MFPSLILARERTMNVRKSCATCSAAYRLTPASSMGGEGTEGAVHSVVSPSHSGPRPSSRWQSGSAPIRVQVRPFPYIGTRRPA